MLSRIHAYQKEEKEGKHFSTTQNLKILEKSLNFSNYSCVNGNESTKIISKSWVQRNSEELQLLLSYFEVSFRTLLSSFKCILPKTVIVRETVSGFAWPWTEKKKKKNRDLLYATTWRFVQLKLSLQRFDAKKRWSVVAHNCQMGWVSTWISWRIKTSQKISLEAHGSPWELFMKLARPRNLD